MFQFPSNGKVEPKFDITDPPLITTLLQFQFPSNGKVEPKVSTTQPPIRELSCFNSLQTGKWSQRAIMRSETFEARSFNSLQTGKWSQREITGLGSTSGNASFNSLQTGKWSQSRFPCAVRFAGVIVSIPFKRESGAKVHPSV